MNKIPISVSDGNGFKCCSLPSVGTAVPCYFRRMMFGRIIGLKQTCVFWFEPIATNKTKSFQSWTSFLIVFTLPLRATGFVN